MWYMQYTPVLLIGAATQILLQSRKQCLALAWQYVSTRLHCVYESTLQITHAAALSL